MDVLNKWGIPGGKIREISDRVWEIDGAYVLKAYENREEMEQNLTLLKALRRGGIPVARVVEASEGQEFVEREGRYFLLTEKLAGDSFADIRQEKLPFQVGRALGQLHLALKVCEKELAVRDNSLLADLQGWVKRELAWDGWALVEESAFLDVAGKLESVYGQLPRQLIHRDVHLGNFLFREGELTGYLDFDLSQRNVRSFDLCYFLTGILTGQDGAGLSAEKWLEILTEVLRGYESRNELTEGERRAFPWIMEGIELLCVAYFLQIKDVGCAKDAARIFHFIRQQETAIWAAIPA